MGDNSMARVKRVGRFDDMEKYRIDQSKGLEFGIYTLADHLTNPHTGERISAQQRVQEIIELAKLADEAGIDFLVWEKVTRNILSLKPIRLYYPPLPKRPKKSKLEVHLRLLVHRTRLECTKILLRLI